MCMKRILILLCITVFLSSLFNACQQKSSDNNPNTIDTLWNDKVQDCFFGIKLGENANRYVEKFQTMNLQGELHPIINDCFSIIFSRPSHSTIGFGTVQWDEVTITSNKGAVYEIAFIKTYQHGQESACNYMYYDLLKKLSSKYKITDVSSTYSNDSTVSELKEIYGKNEVKAQLYKRKYFLEGHGEMINICLDYVSYPIMENQSTKNDL